MKEEKKLYAFSCNAPHVSDSFRLQIENFQRVVTETLVDFFGL